MHFHMLYLKQQLEVHIIFSYEASFPWAAMN